MRTTARKRPLGPARRAASGHRLRPGQLGHRHLRRQGQPGHPVRHQPVTLLSTPAVILLGTGCDAALARLTGDHNDLRIHEEAAVITDDHPAAARAGPQRGRPGGPMRSAVALCTGGWRWAAVAVAAPVLALAAGFITASPARATPPAGVTAQILGSGTTLGGFKIRVDGIKVASEDAASVTVAHLTFAPGGTRHQGYLHIPPARVRPVSL